MTGLSGPVRIGIDLGGTKIAGIALAAGDRVLAERRVATPRDDYDATIAAIAELVGFLDQAIAAGCGTAAPRKDAPLASVGVGIPGSLSPVSGRMQNANSTWLNGRPFDVDLAAALGRPVRLANDANCFALSEATDGAATGRDTVFGVILGTGCGGGIVRFGRIVDGPRGIGGEWGHNPLPWARVDECPGSRCWCGRNGCMETWVSGPALAADHTRVTGVVLSGEAIVAAAASGDGRALATLDRYTDRLARGLAQIVNIIDPDVIVLGGGLSALDHLYAALPERIAPFVFAEAATIDIRPPRWGAASGVRGAARLWGSEG